jgi:hypothetical protein
VIAHRARIKKAKVEIRIDFAGRRLRGEQVEAQFVEVQTLISLTAGEAQADGDTLARKNWKVNSDPGEGRQDHKRNSLGEISPIKFRSFSLGDVFEREINKLGRFAFRGKNQQVRRLRSSSSCGRRIMVGEKAGRSEGLILRRTSLERGSMKIAQTRCRLNWTAHHSPHTHSVHA